MPIVSAPSRSLLYNINNRDYSHVLKTLIGRFFSAELAFMTTTVFVVETRLADAGCGRGLVRGPGRKSPSGVKGQRTQGAGDFLQ